MTRSQYLLFAAVSLFLSIQALAGTTTQDADGGIRLNGERWFPIGLYDTPGDATGFQEIAKVGFDLVRTAPDRKELDLASGAGLTAWIPAGGISEVADAAGEENLAKLVNGVKDHPALAFWELPDEALWNVQYTIREPYEGERNQVRDALNAKIQAGEDVTALKNLYRELTAANAMGDFATMEAKLAELRKALLPDAPPSNRRSLATCPDEENNLYQRLLAGYRTYRKNDPAHLVWQNHAPRNSADLLAKHADYCDLIGCDIYPYPTDSSNGHSDLTDRTLASVGAYTERFSRLAPDKSVLMVLQGFGWRQLYPENEKAGGPPAYRDSRFMAYDAVARGAKAICYWGTNYDDDQKSAWKGLAPVITELASLKKYLAQPETPLPLKIEQTSSWNSQEHTVICSVRKLGEDWLFIFVNELPSAQTVQVEFPAQFVGKRLYLLYESMFMDPVAEGYFPLSFPGYGVRIMSTRNDLEVNELKGLNRFFDEPF